MDNKIYAWNRVLTDEEIAEIASGVSPYLIKPNNLICYRPLENEEVR